MNLRSRVTRAIAASLLIAGCCSPAHAQPSAFERCQSCHSGTDATKDVAPKLSGVFGRKAGTREDFRYSRALTRSGITWDEGSLDAFLKAPEQFIPGTRMPFEGLPADAERAAIIQYLKGLK